MLHIFKKELFSLLNSLVAYITTGLFLVTSGLFLWVFPESSVLDFGYSGLERFFGIAPYLFMFLIPAITMRSFAAERKEGTFELIATLPLTDGQIISGKYLGCLSAVLFSLVPTLIYYITVYRLGVIPGNVDSGAVAGSYIGLFLLGGVFVSVGLFSSSITENPVIAFAVAVFLCFFLFSGFDSASKIIALQRIGTSITKLGINEHYESMSRGVLDSRDLLYFISCTLIFLFITNTILGSRKWRA